MAPLVVFQSNGLHFGLGVSVFRSSNLVSERAEVHFGVGFLFLDLLVQTRALRWSFSKNGFSCHDPRVVPLDIFLGVDR
jgi:hypothetical protein